MGLGDEVVGESLGDWIVVRLFGWGLVSSLFFLDVIYKADWGLSREGGKG